MIIKAIIIVTICHFEIVNTHWNAARSSLMASQSCSLGDTYSTAPLVRTVTGFLLRQAAARASDIFFGIWYSDLGRNIMQNRDLRIMNTIWFRCVNDCMKLDCWFHMLSRAGWLLQLSVESKVKPHHCCVSWCFRSVVCNFLSSRAVVSYRSDYLFSYMSDVTYCLWRHL